MGRRLGVPASRQGVTVLGMLLATMPIRPTKLGAQTRGARPPLAPIPLVQDLPAAWLLLHYCAAPRVTFCVPCHAATTAAYASSPDAAVDRCIPLPLSTCEPCGFAAAPPPPSPSRRCEQHLALAGLMLTVMQPAGPNAVPPLTEATPHDAGSTVPAMRADAPC